jgi:hypothetical protein
VQRLAQENIAFIQQAQGLCNAANLRQEELQPSGQATLSPSVIAASFTSRRSLLGQLQRLPVSPAFAEILRKDLFMPSQLLLAAEPIVIQLADAQRRGDSGAITRLKQELEPVATQNRQVGAFLTSIGLTSCARG